MKKINIFLLSLLVLYENIVSGRTARLNPLKNPMICGRPTCDLENAKFHYNTNIRYKYGYKLHIRSEFSGSGNNKSDIFVNAELALSFPSPCEGILAMYNVNLREEEIVDDVEEDYDYFGVNNYETSSSTSSSFHKYSEQFAHSLQDNDMRFSFHDGVISEICPSKPNEENWILNFKKGIISAFQNTMNRFDIDHTASETDVTGTCDISYKLLGPSGTSLLLQKTKDIKSCKNRYKTNSFLQTVPYDFRENFSVWPILDSKSYCNITVDHNIYQNVNCFERHQLIPFSNNQSGAITESTFSIHLIDEETTLTKSTEENIQITTRSSLLFNHYPTPKPTHDETKTARELLQQMCSLGFPDIQRNFIDIFTKFLQTTRILSYTALRELLTRAAGICKSSFGKNHVIESLPYIGSSASVRIMIDEIISKSVTMNVAEAWISSFAYLPRPDEEMLEGFLNLLQSNRKELTNIKTILSVTAAVHTYCRNHENCYENEFVENIVQYLSNQLELFLPLNIQNKDPINRDLILVLLKGLGNIGVLDETIVKDFREFIENEESPIEYRIQAIFAHNRMDCYFSREYFLDIYEDYDEHVEVRIAAYLQAIRCPDLATIKRIKTILTNEEVNQVGSYVWSHLTNLVKTASPVMIEAQALLVNEHLGNKYKLDIRKFSRNFEYTLFFDEYNAGLRSDANLIFGTESYMPRSLAYNFTVDLFGESVNLFEISTRMQGFEEMAQSTFGPNGKWNTKAVMDQLKVITTWFNDTVNNEEFEFMDKLNLRLKREVDSSAENGNTSTSIQTSVAENLKYKLKYDFGNPSLVYGLKMFGNDIHHGSINGANEFFNTLNKFNLMNQLKQIFKNDKEISYSKSSVFLDVSYDVPLSCGFPLSIQAFGASSLDLHMSGSLKNYDFWKTKKLDIEAKLKPSISLDVLGTMQTDYFYGISGIRVKGNLYSSSSIDAKLKIQNTELASLQFSLPQQRNDIFSIRSELLVMKNDMEIRQHGIDKRYKNSTCTWPFIDRAVGLKLCAKYSLPDVNNATQEYPSLLLSGPILLDIHLDKADPTAKIFLFEYRWIENGTSSAGLLSFNTPNSNIPRVFSAKVISTPNNYNLSMSFVNGNLSYSAVGIYRNTEMEKKLEIYFNSDGRKKFSLEMALNKSTVRNGFMFYPRVLLEINDERVAGLSGTFKITDKKNIIQYDVNCAFETKQVQTRAMGTITRTEVSVSTKMNITYEFLGDKLEYVEIEGELANRGNSQRTEIEGSLKSKSTAYPNFNFNTNYKLLSVMGHVETSLEINNAPDVLKPNNPLSEKSRKKYSDYTLTLRLILSKVDDVSSFDGSRASASIEVTRPASNLELKFHIHNEQKNNYKKGHECNTQILVRFAPRKEATVFLSIHRPRVQYFAIDTVLNVTFPAFEPFTIRLRALEKLPGDYNVDLKGTWFSGQSITLNGVYQDKSELMKYNRHLKLVVTSPQFNDTNVDLRYSQDTTDLSFTATINYGDNPYGLVITHSDRIPGRRSSFAKLKILEKLYTISFLNDPTDLKIEIHIDKIRNIHLALKHIVSESKKEASLTIQWDANRDPTQKLAISFDFNAPRPRTYDGSFSIFYPERTFSGSFDLVTLSGYKGSGHLGWSAYESIELTYDIGYRFDLAQDLWAHLKLNTPFNGWHTNILNAGFYHKEYLFLTNASAIWADNQQLALDIHSDYENTDTILKCEFEIALNSTVNDVPTAKASFRHVHTNKRLDTEITVAHIPKEDESSIFSINSGWQFDANHYYRNISGTILLTSPLNGYRKGVLSTKFSLNDDDKQLRGAADLDLEDKKYTLLLQGYAKKIIDNMFMINITTPIEKFREIQGRFGINEKRKHIVAEMRSSNGAALGVEFRWWVVSFLDFDIIFNVESPLEGFQRIMLIGKMERDLVVLKGGWNKVIVGFEGVWRMVSFTNFEYAYRVFTPFPGFTDSGFVAKIIYELNYNFNLELSVQLKHKLGIVLNMKPKPNMNKLLGRKRIIEFDPFFVKDIDEEDEDEEEDYSNYSDDDESINIICKMDLNTIVWPKIVGVAELEEIGSDYLLNGRIDLSDSKIEIKNRFYFPDYTNVKNSLKIITPYVWLKEIRSLYMHKVIPNAKLLFELEYLNRENWTTIGGLYNYTKVRDEDSVLKSQDLLLIVKTPFELLKTIRFQINGELDDLMYKGNVSIGVNNDTALSVYGVYESEDNYLVTLFGLNLISPKVPIFSMNLYLKKDFSDVDNSLILGLDTQENESSSMLKIETNWKNTHENIDAKCKILTNILPIQRIDTSLYLVRKFEPTINIKFAYANQMNIPMTEYKFNMNRKNELVLGELLTPHAEIGNITLQATLSKRNNNNEHFVTGKLYRSSKLYTISGNVIIQDDIPLETNLKFIPSEQTNDQEISNGGVIELNYKLSNPENGFGKHIQIKTIEQEKFIELLIDLKIFSKVNWKFATSLIGSNGIFNNPATTTITTKSPYENRLDLKTSIKPMQGGQFVGDFSLFTPWANLDEISLSSDFTITGQSGIILNSYKLPLINGSSLSSFTFIPFTDMKLAIQNSMIKSNRQPHNFDMDLQYKSGSRYEVVTLLDVNSLWRFETNGTLREMKKDVEIEIQAMLPHPIGDTHKLIGQYHFDMPNNDIEQLDVNYDLKYNTKESGKRYASRGQYRNVTDLQGVCRIEWGPDAKYNAAELNMQMLRKDQRRDFSVRVATPMHTENSLIIMGSYDVDGIYNTFGGHVNYPASVLICETNISFSSLSNMKGYLNSTTPNWSIKWLKSDFDFTSSGTEMIRYIKATWPTDSAIFNLKSKYNSVNLDNDLHGTILIDCPLTTRHTANIEYSFKQREGLDFGQCVINYNNVKWLDGKYTCKRESNAGFNKDVVDITIENSKQPIGIHFVETFDYHNHEVEQINTKRVEVFDLTNAKSFNITGELYIRTKQTGFDYKIVAIHPNRTVVLTSEYDSQDSVTVTNSKLELAKNIWIAYNIVIENRTQHDNESQKFTVDISYPQRNLSAIAWYALTENTFDSDIMLKWSQNATNTTSSDSTDNGDSNDYYDDYYTDASSDNKKSKNPVGELSAGLNWQKDPIDKNQSIVLTIRHPSFDKDVKFKGSHYTNTTDLLRFNIEVDYCNDTEHLVTFLALVQDQSNHVGYRNYTINLISQHEATKLNLNANASIGIPKPYLYETFGMGQYKRSYLPIKEMSVIGIIDVPNKEIYYLKEASELITHFWIKGNGNNPEYHINGSWQNDASNVNTTGRFYLNIDELIVRLNVNLTPDASQNLLMFGTVPDNKHASFDLWRDYEDIRVVDISYYLRMNHSRLITSKLFWRPKLKTDIKEKLKDTVVQCYYSISDNVDFWIKVLYSESTDAINDIWIKSKPYTDTFLKDVGGLKVIQTDVEDFRIFLNQSYSANDFYVKTMVNFTLTILDELSIRNHIDSVPKILNELWQMLGESGEALHKSILWLIETIKTSYSKAIEMLNRLLNGETLIQLSSLMEKGVSKYDKFVKDLHLSFIKYVESVYQKIINSAKMYWTKTLQRIEPSLIKFMHHIETVVWGIAKELFDFLYKRTNEIAESPYFNTVSNFTQDFDRLYRDIVTNDLLTNVKKYTTFVWHYLTEKYFKYVPFGKELHQVCTGLANDLGKFYMLEPMSAVREKIDEVRARLNWIATELQLEKRMQQLWTIVRNKITYYTQTALENDDKYREAKTKFIFDTDLGVMELEQKLPMSWHSFNETPIFEEIYEYKFLTDIRDYFKTSDNFSIWNFYFEFKRNLDISTWLPPYKSNALLIGSKHYVTFDGNFVSIKQSIPDGSDEQQQCSYLLARDFFNKDFTLLMAPMMNSTRKLLLIVNGTVIDIEIGSSAVRVGDNLTTLLPIKVDDTIIYRDIEMLKIESKNGFQLSCNLHFDLCWFELSGWYFGKTAGVLGNMNNEPYDDYLDQFNKRSKSDNELVKNWLINNQNDGTDNENHSCSSNIQSSELGTTMNDDDAGNITSISTNNENEIICDSFFRSKLSAFVNCYTIVDPIPFYKMCIDLLAEDKNYDKNNYDHPAQKGFCSSALAYIETCTNEKMPMRIPDNCVHCKLYNGSFVNEGTFLKLEGESLPKTADIVFIIEAKECNKNFTHTKSILSVVNALEQQLSAISYKNNRYSVVAFGGDSPFDRPRNIVYNNQIFTDSQQLRNYFTYIQTNGEINKNKDVFEAIGLAAKLVFRPGAAKAFILLPCSECSSNLMKLDYSSILQAMLEQDIQLHVLMDQEFFWDKKRFERLFFGYDKNYGYTKKFLKENVGDKELRGHVKLPKASLGLCMPLALETNGTIFTSKKLMPNKGNPVKKFAAVFAKRVVSSILANTCQECECTGHNTGAAYMSCMSCSSTVMDYGWSEDEINSEIETEYTDSEDSFEGNEKDSLEV